MKDTTIRNLKEVYLLFLFPIIFLCIGLFEIFSSEQSTFEFFLDDVTTEEDGLPDFRYRLEGYETNWHYNAGAKVTYESLPKGEFLLVIQSKPHGEWIEVFSTSKKIHIPPFYLNLWIIVAVILSSLVALYLLFKTRGIQVRSKISARDSADEEEAKSDDTFVVVSGKEQERIDSSQILYVSSHKNYIEIHQCEKSSVVRMKLTEFLNVVPDPAEYMQIRRSLIIRKDKVNKKMSKKAIVNGEELVVGSTYKTAWSELNL